MTFDLYQKTMLIAVTLTAVSVHLILSQRARTVGGCSDLGVLCLLQGEGEGEVEVEVEVKSPILALPGIRPATASVEGTSAPVRH
jgi:hypothetical protein